MRGPGASADEALVQMCHDLVTPAVTMRLLAELIDAEPEASEAVRRLAAAIGAQSSRISELCVFTLELRTAAGAWSRTSAAVDPTGIVEVGS